MPDTPLLPSRLHHGAWTTRDMARTRAFYEEVIGLPLAAFFGDALAEQPVRADDDIDLAFPERFLGLFCLLGAHQP